VRFPQDNLTVRQPPSVSEVARNSVRYDALSLVVTAPLTLSFQHGSNYRPELSICKNRVDKAGRILLARCRTRSRAGII
jgi:hypothetical protein